MQIDELHPEIDALQLRHGAKGLSAIYGAGCIENPKLMLVFMNPTGRNAAANATWNGLRAPWIGTKNIWPLLRELGLLSENVFHLTQGTWSPETAKAVYIEIAKQKVYVTNLAKCTQVDARHLPDSVFREYLPSIQKEISIVNPKSIIAFGNQVSSVLLGKTISVGDYSDKQKEMYSTGTKNFEVYPVYYPVGQGRRNQPLAAKRIRAILE